MVTLPLTPTFTPNPDPTPTPDPNPYLTLTLTRRVPVLVKLGDLGDARATVRFLARLGVDGVVSTAGRVG